MDENNRNYDNQYTDGPSNGPNPSDTWNTPSGSPKEADLPALMRRPTRILHLTKIPRRCRRPIATQNISGNSRTMTRFLIKTTVTNPKTTPG